MERRIPRHVLAVVLGAAAVVYAALSARAAWMTLVLAIAAAALLMRRSGGARSARAAGLATIGLIAGCHALEAADGAERRSHVVTTSVFVPAPAANVWSAIAAFDQIVGSRPLLLRMGLPVPERCTIDRPAVGARRVCHFSSGRIEQRVVGWDPPRRIELVIEEVDLPGRRWFGFSGASYELREQAGGTLVTRTTTVTSPLRPAWCWRWIEALGVEAEHEYLLRSLVQRFQH